VSDAVVVRGGTLVRPDRPLEVADLAIEDGRIRDVGRNLPAGAREVDARGSFVVAGLVDAHTHSGHALAPTLGDNMALEEWMLENVYLVPPLDGEEAYAAALLTAGRLAAAGTVALLDHGPPLGADNWSETIEATMSAYADAGVRATVAPVIADRYLWESLSGDASDGVREAVAEQPFPPLHEHQTLVDRARAFLDRWHGRDANISVLLGPSAPERLSDQLLSGLASLGRERGVGFHLHLFESALQRAARGAAGAVDRLRRLGVLGPGSSVAHCVWVTQEEIAAIASSGTTVVHNPISNLRTGTGLAPLRALRGSGASLALGSDGAVVNEGLDMFSAMKVAALVHKLSGSLDDAPSAAFVLEACQHGGARACGLGRCTLDRGDRADIVVVDGQNLAGREHAQLLNELVYGASGREVVTVLVGGRTVVENGVPTAPGWSETQRWALKRRAERARVAARGQRSRLADALREMAAAARAQRGAGAILDPLGGHR
jgi:cytosine/adenosine deaminase-related metal-dependent hydrolase